MLKKKNNMYLSSEKNERIKNIIQILKNPSRFPDLYIAEGFRTCEMFVKSNFYSSDGWFLVNNLENKIPEYVNAENITFISDNVMNTISRMSTPPGIIGVFKTKKSKNTIDTIIPSTFILDNIQDPGNMGTIIRTAVALNRSVIIIIGGCHHTSYKVIQSSAGMIAHIKIIRTTWEEFIKNRDISFPIYGLSMNGENIMKIKSSEMNDCYWVVGNEAHGLSEESLKYIDRHVTIPMSQFCESLNAGVAAAIAGYCSWST
jgi:TrmH family RNA methyltransferase